MAISKEQLERIINGKAGKLCSAEGTKLINEISSNGRNNQFNDPSPSEYDYDSSYYDQMYTSENNNEDFTINEQNFNNSKVPDFIKESMRNNPIQVNETSVLDGMKIKPKKKPTENKNIIREDSQTKTNNSNIDYSIIKAIVNECLREYFKNNLNESNTLKSIGLKNGTITIIDNNNNAYAAKLQKLKK